MGYAEDQGPVIIFDGECVLCSANAQLVLKHDRRGRFRLAAVQSPAGAALCRRHGVDPAAPATMIVVANGRVLKESDAVLAIARNLGWSWRAAAGMLGLVPGPLRDAAYRLLARNRHRLFGRRAACWVPRPEHRHRIL